MSKCECDLCTEIARLKRREAWLLALDLLGCPPGREESDACEMGACPTCILAALDKAEAELQAEQEGSDATHV